MPETIIDSILTGKLDSKLVVRWLNNESLQDVPEDCVLLCNSRSEFVACFLTYLRNQTDSILQSNASALQIRQRTPDKVLSTRRKHKRSISDPTSDDRTDSLSVKPDRRSHESPSKDRKRGRKVKTKLFNDDRKETSISSDESRISLGMERMMVSSTPMKNGLRMSESPTVNASPVTPQRFTYDRCDTPRLAHRKDKMVSLGDYITSAQKTKKRKSRNASEENESKVDLDISNTEVFPEISRKASSLRSDKRRIKPTNLDGTMSQKSFSLNSFNTECFQQPSPLALEENNVFKNQKLQPKESANSFEAERNILKLERQKLMEKFNLNASTTSIPVTPQIKIIQKDCIEKTLNYVKAEFAKVVFKEKIDLLVELYDVLLKNNLILSLNSEIYFLISILLSKQIEEDYLEIESKLTEKNLTNYLLKSVHNCTYFAVKSLWNLRSILEVILDKTSLKILGENKKVRGYSADLAKFLLNCYGLKCEAESQEKPRPIDKRISNGIVCFNLETDNAENFPSLLSFQNFKKQRDMFYDILRWYTESAAAATGVPRSTLRARVKSLVGAGHSPANHAHLAALLVAHMLAECLHCDQESKLSKLQRRLTCPSGDSRLPHFTDKETFYKELLVNAGSESFRAHVRDALAAELVALDGAPLPQGTPSSRRSRSCPRARAAPRAHVRDALAAELVALDGAPLPQGTPSSRRSRSCPRARAAPRAHVRDALAAELVALDGAPLPQGTPSSRRSRSCPRARAAPRAHVRDALAAELVALDGAPLPQGTPSSRRSRSCPRARAAPRAHVRDALAAELVALDGAPLPQGTPSSRRSRSCPRARAAPRAHVRDALAAELVALDGAPLPQGTPSSRRSRSCPRARAAPRAHVRDALAAELVALDGAPLPQGTPSSRRSRSCPRARAAPRAHVRDALAAELVALDGAPLPQGTPSSRRSRSCPRARAAPRAHVRDALAAELVALDGAPLPQGTPSSRRSRSCPRARAAPRAHVRDALAAELVALDGAPLPQGTPSSRRSRSCPRARAAPRAHVRDALAAELVALDGAPLPQGTPSSRRSRSCPRARAAPRAHVRDALAAELVALDGAPLPQGTPSSRRSRSCPRARAAPRAHVRDALAAELVALDGAPLPQGTPSSRRSRSCPRARAAPRAHVRDALAAELVALDGAPLPQANNNEVSRDYLQLQRKLCLLAKFLGFLASLPYVTLPADSKTVGRGARDELCAEPKERVLNSSLKTRSYSQPALDLAGLLGAAARAGRVAVTLPWLAHYVSMLDRATLRLPYYSRLLAALAAVQRPRHHRLTGIFLDTVLGWLFDLPYVPTPEPTAAPTAAPTDPTAAVDDRELVDEPALFELCPHLREVNVLLATCRAGQQETYRHITPVSLSVNTEDRMRTKEKELQMRLEEELIKSQPSSTRRVLELVIERVTAACVRDLTASVNLARAEARDAARRAAAARGGDLQALLKNLQAIYTSHLTQLRESAQNMDTLTRASGALSALLPLAPRALHAAAARASKAALLRWARDHWTSTAVLCKDIEAEMHNLITLGEAVKPEQKPEAKQNEVALETSVAVSVASAIIHLKEQVCLLLDYEEPTGLSAALATCALACSPSNMFGRGPAPRAILQLSVDLCVVYVSRKPKEVTDSFLNQLHAVWNICCPDRNKSSPPEPEPPARRDLSPELRNFEDDRAPTPPTSDEDNAKPNRNVKKFSIIPMTIKIPSPILSPNTKSQSPKLSPTSPNSLSISPLVKRPTSPNCLRSPASPMMKRPVSPKPKGNSTKSSINSSILSAIEPENTELLEFFDRILCPRNIVLLNSSKCKSVDVWEAMASVLVFLLKFDYLSEDSLTEQCLAVYRQDWPQSVLESLSTCMKAVSSRWTRSSGKFTLFLDFLAEYCGDLELEPMD